MTGAVPDDDAGRSAADEWHAIQVAVGDVAPDSEPPVDADPPASDRPTEVSATAAADVEIPAVTDTAVLDDPDVVWIRRVEVDPLVDAPVDDELTDEAENASVEWHQDAGGRWVVGDPGRQRDVVARVSRIAQTRPDLTLDWARAGCLEFRAASVRGLGHFDDGKPRQDACGVGVEPSGRWLVGCVADGVSSAAQAHQAADAAAAGFTAALGNELAEHDIPDDPLAWPPLARGLGWQAITDQVSSDITALAEAWFRRRYERSDDSGNLSRLDADEFGDRDARRVMATTAVAFAVATAPMPDGRVPFALAVAAGDSSALVLSDAVWHPVSAVKNAGAEVASSAVAPLPRATEVAPVVGYLEPGQALVVVTDGIGDPLGSGGGVVGRFLAERWSTPPDALAFAHDISFYRKSFVDDRTAVAVWVGSGA